MLALVERKKWWLVGPSERGLGSILAASAGGRIRVSLLGSLDFVLGGVRIVPARFQRSILGTFLPPPLGLGWVGFEWPVRGRRPRP
ncbi:hypothetical protein R1flu_028907 [Riccia fluitans]|uniref:Uncharacterized protein n=1 Tax=Riccia fluitans TaxID=41844 RepID=A0ABD1XNJ1_9MARC